MDSDKSLEPDGIKIQSGDEFHETDIHGHSGDNQEDQLEGSPSLDENRIIKHIMVIGFHHKHGYQVDYCYPPLEPDGPTFSTPTNPITLPDLWKTLPLLCLPDGSHNYDSDTIYFTMPDNQQPNDHDNIRINSPTSTTATTNQQKLGNEINNPNEKDTNPTSEDNNTQEKPTTATNPKIDGIKTIFGTACYRQIQADKLLNRTDDMTRIAVQKSVCVLSSMPLFGLIRTKLEMITHAYFEELDFSKVSILKLTYDNLNNLLKRESIRENATFLGLSARQLISHFGYNTLVLYKAMLLEKKILFYKSPVRDLCSTILSICSLFTGLLESGGLNYSTCDLQLSASLLETLGLLPQNPTLDSVCCDQPPKPPAREEKVLFTPAKERVVIISGSKENLDSTDEIDSGNNTNQGNIDESKQDDNLEKPIEPTKTGSNLKSDNKPKRSRKGHSTIDDNNKNGDYVIINDYGDDLNDLDNENDHDDDDDEESDIDEGTDPSSLDSSLVDDQQALKLCRIKPEDCGLPLQIFTRGSFCLPYLSITYLDLLSDPRVKSFVIGATNFLFKQKRDMYDVIVDMEENNIIINDPNLKRCLRLTTEDLRFMDNLSRHVKSDSSNLATMNEFDLISHDIARWVGGDEWIRYHFRLYTLYLLKISRCSTGWDQFNGYFVQAWKQTTNNYKIWESTNKGHLIDSLQCRHPSSGRSNYNKGLNFNDMKLKLSYAVNTSYKGRMINETLNGIGKWSIWNNIATVAGTAATSAAATLSSATNQIVSNTTRNPRQEESQEDQSNSEKDNNII